MEQSGYNVEGDHATYPAQSQAAEQRVQTNSGVVAIVRFTDRWFVCRRRAQYSNGATCTTRSVYLALNAGTNDRVLEKLRVS